MTKKTRTHKTLQVTTMMLLLTTVLVLALPAALADQGGAGIGNQGGGDDVCLDTCFEPHPECQNLWETCEGDGWCRWFDPPGCCDPILFCDHFVCCYGPGCGPGCAPPFCGDGIQDGWEECDDGNWDNGDGCDWICQEEICGNGIVQVHIGEECDDGNTEDGDGCSSTCQNEGTPWCGNGGTCTDDADCDDDNTDETCSPEGYCVESGEECDDANGVQGDGCDMCVLEGGGGAVCGDGIIEGLEECDDGDIDPDDTYITENGIDNDGFCVIDLDFHPEWSCQLNTCGDGYLDVANEECDDGNGLDGDGCSATCTTEPISGCDGPNQFCMWTSNGECPRGDGNVYEIVHVAGDDSTYCDLTYGATYGASVICCEQVQCPGGVCGDGIPEGPEQCDDGITTDTFWNVDRTDDDGTCVIDGDQPCMWNVCGDGYLDQSTEFCDDDERTAACDTNGENPNTDGACTLTFCGDGRTQGFGGGAEDIGFNGEQAGGPLDDGNEECDDGVLNSDVVPDACRTNCADFYCGDGVQDSNEECDDGNTDDGDGCSSVCTIEVVDPFCGDGIKDGDEQCDDGNNDPNDGCNAICEIEYCGDGVTQDQVEVIPPGGIFEQCDAGAGNGQEGTGCSGTCQIIACGVEICGNGIDDDCDGLIDEGCPPPPCGGDCDDTDDRRTEICGCGDLIIDIAAGEQCDDGGYCSGNQGQSCTTHSECGADGPCIPLGGDGCDENCLMEQTDAIVVDFNDDVTVHTRAEWFDGQPVDYEEVGDEFLGWITANGASTDITPYVTGAPDGTYYGPLLVDFHQFQSGYGFSPLLGGTYSVKYIVGGDIPWSETDAYTLTAYHYSPMDCLSLPDPQNDCDVYEQIGTLDLAIPAVPDLEIIQVEDQIQFISIPGFTDDGVFVEFDHGLAPNPIITGIILECVDQGGEINCNGIDEDCDGLDGPCPVCGDGVQEGPEECDDGVDTDTYHLEDDTDDDGACVIDDALPINSCKTNVCGDGYLFGPVEGGSEQCDDGNTDDGDGCSSICELEAVCGNGLVEGLEECDDADDTDTYYTENELDFDGACVIDDQRLFASCLDNVCGDGYLYDVTQGGTEECDLGPDNGAQGSGCLADCTLEPSVCGDGVVGGNEQCDDGGLCDDDVTACTSDTDCGGGTCTPRSNDGCSDICEFEICGDNIVHTGEECDDGAASGNNDACIISELEEVYCKNAFCGDGFVWNTDGGTELCDDGMHCADGTQCFVLNSVCGDASNCEPRDFGTCNAQCDQFQTEDQDSFVVDIECAINDDANWQSCYNLGYGDVLEGVRAKCFSWDASNPVDEADAAFIQWDIAESESEGLDPDGEWLSTTDFSEPIEHSGLISVEVECDPSEVPICSADLPDSTFDWSVPFGAYFNFDADYNVDQACCDGSLNDVSAAVINVPSFDSYLLEHYQEVPPGNLDQYVLCEASATPCADGMTTVFTTQGSLISGPNEQVVDTYMCCAPELSVSQLSGQCLNEYVPIVHRDTDPGLPIMPPAQGLITICAAPKDATEVLDCVDVPAGQNCNGAQGYGCVYAVDDAGRIGSCEEPNDSKYCCRRQTP